MSEKSDDLAATVLIIIVAIVFVILTTYSNIQICTPPLKVPIKDSIIRVSKSINF